MNACYLQNYMGAPPPASPLKPHPERMPGTSSYMLHVHMPKCITGNDVRQYICYMYIFVHAQMHHRYRCVNISKGGTVNFVFATFLFVFQYFIWVIQHCFVVMNIV